MPTPRSGGLRWWLAAALVAAGAGLLVWRARQARLARLPRPEAALRSAMAGLGITPALTLSLEKGPGNSLALEARLPRALDPSLALDALRKALGRADLSLVSSRGPATAPEGLEYDWDFRGPLGSVSVRALRGTRPALALLVDDWGYYDNTLPLLLALPRQVSLAVFPGLTYSRQIAEAASRRGHEILLHLPMQPERAMPLVPGTLLVSMPDSQLESMTRDELDSVPDVVGVNNHEGSLATQDPRLMGCVLRVLKERGLYFLDSLTTPQSVAGPLAARMGVRTATRQVFLDNKEDLASVEAALRGAARLALKRGTCIAIGHPHPNTLKAMAALVPEFQGQGIELVPVSELVR